MGGLHIPLSTELSGAGLHFEFGNCYIFQSSNDVNFLLNVAWMGINLNLSIDPELKLSFIEIQPLKFGPGFRAKISEKANWIMMYQVMPTFGFNTGGVVTNSNYRAIFHGPWIGVNINNVIVGAEIQLGQMNFADENNLSKSDRFITYARFVVGTYF